MKTKKYVYGVCGYLVLSILASMPSMVFGEINRGAHEQFIKSFTQAFHDVLVENGLCSDEDNCRKKRMLFFGPSGKDLYISIYSINDFGLIKDIVNCVFHVRGKEGYENSLNLEIYSEKHTSNFDFIKGFFEANNPILTMYIGKEKK